jgi:predicted O-methyltransferase YrrM
VKFHEDWYAPSSLLALRAAFHRSDGVPGRIIEVGCWEGRSTIVLARACAPDVLHAVDTWEGSPGEVSADLAQQRDVYATFMANIDMTTGGNVLPFRMGWRDYFAAHAGPIRFLHIDATHTYDEVRDNISAALPHLSPGGVICGDDRSHPPVAQAVFDVLGIYQYDANLWWWQLGD